MKNNATAKYKWVVLAVMIMCGLNNVYFQYQMSPIADKIQSQFGLSLQQYSSLFTAPMAPAIFVSLICGIIVDKFGAKKAIAIALVVQAIGVWGRVYTTNYALLYFFMFIPGFACTFINANSAKILGEWFDGKMVGIAVGVYLASSAIGQGIATSTTALLPSVKSAYFISAVYATVMIAVWVFLYRSNKSENSEQSKTVEEKPSILENLKAVVKTTDVMLTCIIIMCAYGALLNITQFMPSILKDRGVDSVRAGTMASVISYGQLAGSLTGPAVISRMKSTRRAISGLAVIAAILYVSAAFLPTGILMIVILALLGGSIGALMPVLMSTPVRLKSIGIERAGTAGGTVSTFQLFGAVVLPSYLIVPLSGGNWTKLIVIGACLLVIAFVTSLFYSSEVDTK